MRRGWVLVLVTGLVVAPPADAKRRIARLWAGTTVRAQRGLVVWSALDPRRNEFHLMLRRGRRVEALPVAPAAVPFDVDLGTDSRGRPELAYSRCRVTRRGEECDLRVLSLAGRPVERLVRNAVSAANETSPTLWHGRIVWARERRDRRTVVLTRPLMARRTVRTRVRRALLDRPDAEVESMELRGRDLAVVSVSDEPGVTALRLLRLGGARRLVTALGRGEGGQTLMGPSFSGGRLVWEQTCLGDPAGCDRGGGIWRYQIATGRYEHHYDHKQRDGFAVRGDGRALAVQTLPRTYCPDPSGGDEPPSRPGCELALLDPLRFVPRSG